jgi:phosphonate transport system ATP-binding protein
MDVEHRVIQVRNISQTYPGGIKALGPTSIDFRTGEFTVLLGPSGAGKSTLLRCLNLLNAPSSGDVRVAALGELKSRRIIRTHRLRTGMIFQQHHLIGRYSAVDNVLMGRVGFYGALRSLFPLPRQDQLLAMACLDQVGLAHKALERADRLSGGEQQRLGIARALAQRPQLVLADEPVASLDPTTASHVLSLLHQISKMEKLTVIVSLHQVEFAKAFADRIIGLSQGKVVFDGPVNQLTGEALEKIYARSAPAGYRETEQHPTPVRATLSRFSALQQ